MKGSNPALCTLHSKAEMTKPKGYNVLAWNNLTMCTYQLTSEQNYPGNGLTWLENGIIRLQLKLYHGKNKNNQARYRNAPTRELTPGWSVE